MVDAPPDRPRRSGLVRALVALVAVALLGYAVLRQGHAVRTHLGDASIATLAAAVGLVLVALGCALQSWRALLADLGSPLGVRAAARVFFLGQLAKYVPGSVWSLVAQVELGCDFGVPRQRSATAGVLLYPLNVTVAAAVAATALPLAGVHSGNRWVLVVLVVLAGAVLLHPNVQGPLLDRLLRLVRRGPLERRPSPGGMLRAAGWSAMGFLAYGAHILLLSRALGVRGGFAHVAALATGAFALAWLVGFLVVIAPAGAGVREAALAAVLAGSMSHGAPLALALLSRFVITLTEGLAAAAAAFAGRGVRRELLSTRDGDG